MPEANGLDILKVIRQLYEQSELPVLFVTGSKDPKVLSKILIESSMKPIQKPFNHDDFITRVFDALK